MERAGLEKWRKSGWNFWSASGMRKSQKSAENLDLLTIICRDLWVVGLKTISETLWMSKLTLWTGWDGREEYAKTIFYVSWSFIVCNFADSDRKPCISLAILGLFCNEFITHTRFITIMSLSPLMNLSPTLFGQSFHKTWYRYIKEYQFNPFKTITHIHLYRKIRTWSKHLFPKEISWQLWEVSCQPVLLPNIS